MDTVSVQVTINFETFGITGSIRYKPLDPARKEERRKQGRVYASHWRKKNLTKERRRWRKVAAERRQRDPDSHHQAMRDYYRKNRKRLLAVKREEYARKTGVRV